MSDEEEYSEEIMDEVEDIVDDIVPNVNVNVDYKLLDITEDGYVNLSTDDGSTKKTLKLPTDETLLTQIKTEFSDGKNLVVSVSGAVGEEQIIATKEVAPK